MKIKYSYLLVVALVGLSAVLAYDAFTSFINPYLSVSDIATNNAAYVNKEIQVLGKVGNGSSTWADDSFLFNLTDGQHTIRVKYDGSPPQNFQENQDVVVVGRLLPPNSLIASEMLVKCPSKYEGEQASLFTDPVFLAAIGLGGVALIYYVVLFLRKS